MGSLSAIADEAEGEVMSGGLVLGGGAVRGVKGSVPSHGNLEGVWVTGDSDQNTIRSDDREKTVPILPPASSSLRKKSSQLSAASTTVSVSDVGSEAAFLLGGGSPPQSQPSPIPSVSIKKVSIGSESNQSSSPPNSRQYGEYLDAENLRYKSSFTGQGPADFPSFARRSPTINSLQGGSSKGSNYLNASNLHKKDSPTISSAGSAVTPSLKEVIVEVPTPASEPASSSSSGIPLNNEDEDIHQQNDMNYKDESTPFHNLLRQGDVYVTAPERSGSTEVLRTGLVIPDSPPVQKKPVSRPFQGKTFHETAAKKYPARRMRYPSVNAATTFVPMPQDGDHEPILSQKQHSRLEARDLSTLYVLDRPTTDLSDDDQSTSSEPFDLAVQVGTDRVDSLGRAIHLLETEMRRLKSTFGAVNEVLLDTVEAQLDLHKECNNMTEYQKNNCRQWMGNLREVLTGERESLSHLARLRSIERSFEKQPPPFERAKDISKDLAAVASRYEEWKIYVMKALQTHKVIQAEVNDWKNVSYGRLGDVRWDIQRLQSRLDIAKEQLDEMLQSNCVEHTKIDPNIIMNTEGLQPSWLQGSGQPPEGFRDRFPFLPENGVSDAVKDFVQDTATTIVSPDSTVTAESELHSTFTSGGKKSPPSPQQSPSLVSVFSSPSVGQQPPPTRKGFQPLSPPTYDHIFKTKDHPKTKNTTNETLNTFLDLEQLAARRLPPDRCLLEINSSGDSDTSVLVMRNLRAGVVGGHPSLNLMSISNILTDSLLLDRISKVDVMKDVAGGLILTLSQTSRSFESPRRTWSKVGDLTVLHETHGGRRPTERDAKYDLNFPYKTVSLRETERSLSKNRSSSPRPASITYKMQMNISDRDKWIYWIKSNKFNPYSG